MNKEKLEAIAFETNDLLIEYIAIHDKVLKEASSFWSLFKNVFLRKPVNFQGLCDDIRTILLKLNSKQKEIDELKSSLYDEFTQSQKDFFNCLTEYIDALVETVDALYKKVNLCYQKSQNKIVLSFEELQEADKHYQEYISKYQRIGQNLNELYESMEVEEAEKNLPKIAFELLKSEMLDIIMESEELRERLRQIGEEKLLLATRQFLLLYFPGVIKTLKLRYATKTDDIASALHSHPSNICSRLLALEIYFEHRSQGK